jgi:hypothetical protein
MLCALPFLGCLCPADCCSQAPKQNSKPTLPHTQKSKPAIPCKQNFICALLTNNHLTLPRQVNRNNQDAKSSGTTDARNLSGGERSFTTLAFELSMWEFCETP